MEKYKYELKKVNTYHDINTGNIIVLMEVQYEGDERPIYIVGTHLGCSIMTEDITKIQEANDENKMSRSDRCDEATIIEIDYVSCKEQSEVGRYHRLILEHINYVIDGNFTKFGKALVPINWIPEKLLLPLSDEDLQMIKEHHIAFVGLHENGVAEFLTADDIGLNH